MAVNAKNRAHIMSNVIATHAQKITTQSLLNDPKTKNILANSGVLEGDNISLKSLLSPTARAASVNGDGQLLNAEDTRSLLTRFNKETKLPPGYKLLFAKSFKSAQLQNSRTLRPKTACNCSNMISSFVVFTPKGRHDAVIHTERKTKQLTVWIGRVVGLYVLTFYKKGETEKNESVAELDVYKFSKPLERPHKAFVIQGQVAVRRMFLNINHLSLQPCMADNRQGLTTVLSIH